MNKLFVNIFSFLDMIISKVVNNVFPFVLSISTLVGIPFILYYEIFEYPASKFDSTLECYVTKTLVSMFLIFIFAVLVTYLKHFYKEREMMR